MKAVVFYESAPDATMDKIMKILSATQSKSGRILRSRKSDRNWS